MKQQSSEARKPRANHRVEPEHGRHIEWLPLDEITVEERAQRPLDENHVKHLVEHFDPDALGFPYIAAIPRSANTERFIAIDGQHRCEAARRVLGPGQHIQCEVVRGISVAEAARLFIVRNASRHATALNKYLVNLTAHDPETEAIEKILKAHGLQVGRTMGATTLKCVVALQRLYRHELEPPRGKHLNAVLTLAQEAWGNTNDSFNGDILRGLGFILAKHGTQVDLHALKLRLAGMPNGPVGLLGKARGLRDSLQGSVSFNVARAAILAYNARRSKGKLALPGISDDQEDSAA